MDKSILECVNIYENRGNNDDNDNHQYSYPFFLKVSSVVSGGSGIRWMSTVSGGSGIRWMSTVSGGSGIRWMSTVSGLNLQKQKS